jgi:hypothetical protein
MLKLGRLALVLSVLSAAACARTRDYARPILPEDVDATARIALFEANRLDCGGPICRHGDGSIAAEVDGVHPGFSQTEQLISNDRSLRQGVVASGVALFLFGAWMSKNFSDDIGRNTMGSDSVDAQAAQATLGVSLAMGGVLALGAILWPEPDVEQAYNDALQQELDERYLLTQARRRKPAPPQLSRR